MQSRLPHRALTIVFIAALLVGAALLPAVSSHADSAARTFRMPPIPSGARYPQGVTIPGLPFSSSNVDVSRESGPQSETTIAASPTNPNSLVAGSNDIATLQDMMAAYSTNGGQSWTRSDIPIGATCAGHGPGSIVGDPGLVAGPTGEYFFSYIGFCGDGTGEVDVAHSTDGGKTWTRQVAFPNVAAGYTPDKDQMGVDDNPNSPTKGRVYVSWDENFPSGTQHIVLIWSDDNGITWHKPVKVDINSSGGVIYGTPAVGPDGRVYVIWNDYGVSSTGKYSLIKVAAASNTPAAGYVPTFTSNVTVAATGINLFFPSRFTIPAQPDRGIAADPSIYVDSHNRVYALWTQGKQNAAVTDVEVQTSTDAGATWSKPVQVNDDNTPGNFSTGASDFFPWGAIDPASGAFYVSFYSTRLDSTNQTTNVYLAVSTNGGASFSANTKITTVASNESVTNPNRDVGNNYGDYEGLTFQGGKAHPVWTDTRFITTAQEEVFTASH